MRFIAFLLPMLLIGACAKTPSGLWQEKFAQAAREVGVNPVYPPREEFQVGDIFLVSVEPDNPNSSASVWIGSSTALRADAQKFLKTRVVFADTGVRNGDLTGKDILSQVDMVGEEIATREGEWSYSLPVSAFPSITAQAGFTASTGLVAAMAALGLGASEQTSVTLDFNDVRTYWVPQIWAADHETEVVIAADKYAHLAAEELVQKVATLEYNQGRKSRDRCLKLAMVTRVYLTREIDYTYRDRQIVAAGLKFAENEKKLAAVAAPPTINVQVMASGRASDTAEDIDAEFAETAKIAEAMRTAVVASANQTGGQGGSLSFTSWSARGLTFKQTYQRPVAIGWDGPQFWLAPGNYAGQPSCLGAIPTQ